MKISPKVALSVLLIAFVFSSCAKKIMFNSSAVVPAARGEVKVKKDGNSNYVIELDVKNLADSKKLTPPKETYVVWIETDNNGTKNIGQINSSSGLLSSALKASLKAVSSFRPSAVFITAEDNADMQYPGGTVVLRTNNFNVK